MKLLCAGLALVLLQTLQAETLLNEQFDELNPQFTVTSVGAFTAIGGTNVDILGAPPFTICNAPESAECVDLNGSGGNAQGQLQSNLLFAPGNYLLSFDLIGTQVGYVASATVTLGNYNESFILASDDDSTGVVTNALVTVTNPSYLLFASDIPGNIGLLLDNVVVSTAETTSSSAPEPSSLLLLGLGITGALAWRLRRFPLKSPDSFPQTRVTSDSESGNPPRGCSLSSARWLAPDHSDTSIGQNDTSDLFVKWLPPTQLPDSTMPSEPACARCCG